MCIYLIFSKAVSSALLIKLQWVMNDKRSQFTIMNDTVKEKRITILVTTNSFAHKPDGLLLQDLLILSVCMSVCLILSRLSFKICRLTLNEVGRGELVLTNKVIKKS